MSTLTIRLPDDKHERLKALARSNSISINKLMDELATVALANYDATGALRDARGARQSQTGAEPCSTSSTEQAECCLVHSHL